MNEISSVVFFIDSNREFSSLSNKIKIDSYGSKIYYDVIEFVV